MDPTPHATDAPKPPPPAVHTDTKLDLKAPLPPPAVVAPVPAPIPTWEPGQPVPPQGIAVMGGVLLPHGAWDPNTAVPDEKRLVEAIAAYPYAEVRGGKYEVLYALLMGHPLDFVTYKWLLDIFRGLNQEDEDAKKKAEEAKAAEAAGADPGATASTEGAQHGQSEQPKEGTATGAPQGQQTQGQGQESHPHGGGRRR